MGNSNASQAAAHLESVGGVPAKMKRIVLVEAAEDLEKAKFEVQEFDVPVPKSGEVLVRVAAAPVNPSDYGSWKASRAGVKPTDEAKDATEEGKDEPAAKKEVFLGNEGCGIVVASGGGMKANGLLGVNVGIVNMQGGGSYQEYVCVDAMQGCFPLPADCPVEDAASFFINPYTAVGIMATAKEVDSPGFVHTAASSQVGQMLVKLCKQDGVTLINVVRRPEQVEMLKAIGAEHVVDSSKETWKQDLAKLVKEHKITCAFDAIAGTNTGDIMEGMPNRSTTFVYGGLSEKPVGGMNPMDLIYRGKEVKGWILNKHLKGASGGALGMGMRINKMSAIVNPGLANGWASSQFVDVKPEDMWTKFLEMRKGNGFTNKKLRIRWPQPEPVAPAAAADAALEEPAAASEAPAAAAETPAPEAEAPAAAA